jgi:hypothetical protein
MKNRCCPNFGSASQQRILVPLYIRPDDWDGTGHRRSRSEVDRIAWSALHGLTAHGIGWISGDADSAHSRLALGSVLTLEWDTAE